MVKRHMSVVVNLHLIRHGYSCANAVKAENGIPIWNLIAHHLYSDPDLTEVSVQKVREAAAANPTRFNLVVTSPLLRAIKTGIIYAQKSGVPTVHSTPWLNELTDWAIADMIGLNQDNTAEAAQLQQAYIQADSEFAGTRVDASARAATNAMPVKASQVEENYAELVSHVVRKVCGMGKSKVDVAVVGHSHYFKTLVPGLEHTPNGTELAVHTLTISGPPACSQTPGDNAFRVTSSEWKVLKQELKESGSEGCSRRWGGVSLA